MHCRGHRGSEGLLLVFHQQRRQLLVVRLRRALEVALQLTQLPRLETSKLGETGVPRFLETQGLTRFLSNSIDFGFFLKMGWFLNARDGVREGTSSSSRVRCDCFVP